MSGKFLKIVSPPHPCKPPKIKPKVMDIGTLWQCDCGRVYRISIYYDLYWSLVKDIKK